MTPAFVSSSNAGDIDVSVLLVTYNHADYIRAAAESVLGQRTSRRFELLISEDASTDGTREIVEEIAAGDPGIRTIFSRENLKSNETVLRAIQGARGRYICLLDGDDLWLADDKIDRQADILDADDTLSGCFHNAHIALGNAFEPEERRWTPASQPSRTTAAMLWEGNPFATCAGMLRRSALGDLGSWYVDCFPITDWPLYLLCSEHGGLLFVDEPVGLYRLHDRGEMSGIAEEQRLKLVSRFYRQMKLAADGRWAEQAGAGGSLYFAGEAVRLLAQEDRQLARQCVMLALQAGGVGRSISWRAWLGLLRRSWT